MRLLYLGGNILGVRVLRWLVEQGVEIAGLVLHPPERRRCGDEFLAATDLPAERIFDGSQLRKPEVLEAIREVGADMALSVMFGYILRPKFLDLFPRGAVNLHPSLLPYNRGAHPNAWSLVEGTPAGVTLHRIDRGVDTGDVLAQREVPVHSIDTAGTLYDRLLDAGFELVVEQWSALARGDLEPRPQDETLATLHRVRDLATLEIDPDATVRAGDLINLLRARTCPPYAGASFVDEDGRRVEVRVALRYLDEDSP